MNYNNVIKIDSEISKELIELKFDLRVRSINLVLLELIKQYRKLNPNTQPTFNKEE